MFANFIWWTAIALEVVILFRGALTGLLKKYPLFFTYIGCVLLKEIIGLLTNALAPKVYAPLYPILACRPRHHSCQLCGHGRDLSMVHQAQARYTPSNAARPANRICSHGCLCSF